ncbi:MAG: MFS transporter, partial [Caulobacteraceae bacterium]|nr:MFS transporter [Caulobacteraceae bacterium]
VNAMRHGQATIEAMLAHGIPLDSARAALWQAIDGQAVMLATNNMFAAIAICLGLAAALIWLVPKPKGPIDTSGAH